MPSPKVHENVYGAVPPVAVALKEFAVPTELVVGPVIDTASASGATVTACWADAVAVFESATERTTVLLPLVV